VSVLSQLRSASQQGWSRAETVCWNCKGEEKNQQIYRLTLKIANLEAGIATYRQRIEEIEGGEI
jgi:hypothetical protein